ncbi:E3 SUMO-protein ligase ZNF451 [Bombina bombina]|uniref:E3 SUMO-protein ligase ZNF451 n=1 Tax=Bombina bombina TaxID=8345 RepID=UPI00235AC5F4|nr:E3 SUMO-protein ligase ZNF451 [Bombina bombina]
MESEISTEDTAKLQKQSDQEIEFVCEEPLRPVLEFVSLISSDDDEEDSYICRKVKDHIDRQKDRVASTLDRLARHVEVEKQQKEEKNKAFQEKVHFQHAHGLQELQCIKENTNTDAARICVNQWLKMPGLKPGVVNSSRRIAHQPDQQRSMNSKSIVCPIMNCNRKFDNGHLLLGHLKRFDHSPCDPTIALHGTPFNSFSCVICLGRFATIKDYKDHMSAKAKLLDGHERHVPPQVIQCFACPSCYLLFTLRDECLQHMSGRNHFQQAIQLGDENGTQCPIPFPAYAKNVLIALCKEVPFQIFCTSCRHELGSHLELTAHFRTRCRNAGPTSRSEKTIARVAEIFRIKALCFSCKKVFKNDSDIAKHKQQTNHKVRLSKSMEESIMAFCFINEGRKTPSDFSLSAANARLKPCMLKRTLNDFDQPNVMKCKKELENTAVTGIPGKKANNSEIMVTSWFCECCLKFSTEATAENHILKANRIFYKCKVCNKLAEDLSIIHLHMSRFHGGAHLNNFGFWCRACSVEQPRMELMMAHVSENHGGHSYYYEKETVEEQPASSTSAVGQTKSKLSNPETPTESTLAKGEWQCHICEEMFDSEDSVKQHCKSLNTHQFYKYSCTICKKRFHKIETLFRHSQHQHDGDIKMEYFCGLCEDLNFEQEIHFLEHYEKFHSMDYMFVPEQAESPIKNQQESSSSSTVANEDRLTCGCLEHYVNKRDRKEDGSQCLANLLQKGKLWYSCGLCSVTGQSFENVKNHLCKENKPPQSTDIVVKCSTCTKIFSDADSAQRHFHDKHCFLQKPNIKDYFGSTEESEIFRFTASVACAESKPLKAAKKSMFEESHFTNVHIKTESLPFSTETQMKSDNMETEDMDTGAQENELPDLDYLRTMTHVVFIDLDNWANFFTHLPGYLNQGTFIWGFKGGKTNWKPPNNCKVFNYLSKIGSFFLHPHCTDRKDAADFAICIHAGRLDEQLPKHIPFTVLSGDKGFLELENQFKKTQRPAHILNPHHLEGEMMCALLNSISDTTKDTDDNSMEIDEDEDAVLEEAIKRSLIEK